MSHFSIRTLINLIFSEENAFTRWYLQILDYGMRCNVNAEGEGGCLLNCPDLFHVLFLVDFTLKKVYFLQSIL